MLYRKFVHCQERSIVVRRQVSQGPTDICRLAHGRAIHQAVHKVACLQPVDYSSSVKQCMNSANSTNTSREIYGNKFLHIILLLILFPSAINSSRLPSLLLPLFIYFFTVSLRPSPMHLCSLPSVFLTLEFKQITQETSSNSEKITELRESWFIMQKHNTQKTQFIYRLIKKSLCT